MENPLCKGMSGPVTPASPFPPTSAPSMVSLRRDCSGAANWRAKTTPRANMFAFAERVSADGQQRLLKISENESHSISGLNLATQKPEQSTASNNLLISAPII